MRSPGFLGPSYLARARDLAYQQLVNLYPVLVESKTGRDVGAFYATPGLTLITTVDDGPVRALHRFNSIANHPMGDTLLVVSGANLYSLDTTFTATNLGMIGTTSSAVSIIDNGTQAAIFDGTQGYLTTGGALSPLSLPFSNPGSAIQLDGFGLVVANDTQNFYQSDLLDLSTWNSLKFGIANVKSDNIIALASLHRQVFVIKETNTEFWVNAGLPNFTFQRLEGVFTEAGCVAVNSVARGGEALFWLAATDQGFPAVVKCTGYAPEPVSTDAQHYAFSRYSRVDDAIAYVYYQEGHRFYVLSFPSGNETWVYDDTVGLWHQRAALGNGLFSRHWGQCAAVFAGKLIIGDYRNGNLYTYDQGAATDNGTQRKWVRGWRALPKPTMHGTRFNALTIDMTNGIGVPDGTDPLVMLRWSDDGGHNWSSEVFAHAGKTGETGRRVKFKRLGSTRQNVGTDRIFELSSTDAFTVALIGADLE